MIGRNPRERDPGLLSNTVCGTCTHTHFDRGIKRRKKCTFWVLPPYTIAGASLDSSIGLDHT